jgi:ElaB/YqjD/DUF883 family membrane-anchored ribosome-binding protein
MSDDTPEMIELQMSETRDSLTQKINALENQVVGTLHDATSTVSGLLDSVKTVVPDTIAGVQDAVTEQVNTTFNISRHTREKPWAMVGGATALGFISGMLLFRRVYASPAKAGQTLYTPPAAAPQTVAAATPRTPVKLPGWLDQIVDKLATKMTEEIRKIGELAVDTASTSLKQTVETALPKLLGNLGESRSSSADGVGANGYHVVGRM